MPARYRASSEYKKKFRWHESVKSASFTPAPDQKAPKAGLGSGDIGYVRSEVREPPLQRRRKPLTSQLTHTIKQVNYGPSDAESDDFGKAIPGILASAKTYKVPQRHTAADISSNTRKPVAHTNGHSKTAGKPAAHTNGAAKTSAVLSGHRDPRSGVSTALRKVRHDSGSKASDTNRNNNKTTSRHAKTSPRGSDKAAKTDKAQSNIALQYQAGIHPNRPKSAKYLSEYQRQFEWKKPLPKESPLMAAEQMVYSSNTNLAPHVANKIPMHKHTTYQKQFKPWQPLAPPPQDLLMENAQREIKAKYMVKTKSKKGKKSVTTPDRMQAAGVPSVTTHEPIEQLKSSQNPQHPFFPHSTIRKWRSEYNSNYKSPTKYQYEDGVWKGAAPPHMKYNQPKDDSQSDQDRRQAQAAAASSLRRTKSQHDIPNWFAEVLELRKKAQEYRQRARGTHFSKEHVAQLIAKQAQMWDASSTSASTSSLSAVSAEPEKDGRIAEQPRRAPEPIRPAAREQDNNNNDGPTRRKLAWPEDNPEDRVAGKPSPGTDSDHDRTIGRIPTPDGFKGSVSASSDDFELIEENGRAPTPELKEKGIDQRHHLQRTTPTVGGAILTSPQAVRKTLPSRPSAPAQTHAPPKLAPARTQGPSIIPGGTDKVFELFSSDEDDDDHPTPKAITPPRQTLAHQTKVIQKSPPPAGIVTRDPHPLNNKMSSPKFQRHSENFFETNPLMPEMPRTLNDARRPLQTWAAPRDKAGFMGHIGGGGSTGEITTTSESGSEDDDDEMRRVRTMPPDRGEDRIEDRPRPATMHEARKGPLDRPNSGSLYGRPMTAYPQTRQAAGDSNIPPTSRYPDHPVTRPEYERPAAKTWTVPRETNVGALNRGLPNNDIPVHGRDASTMSNQGSDRLSMSGISSVSSSTLASEVLERARKRRDEFWGMP